MARRGYAQLSNGLWLNNKANELMDTDPRAFCMWIMSLSYASDNMTDGLLNVRALRRLGCDDRTRDALIECGMWEDAGDGCVRIHDYLKHNMSRESIESVRDKAAERKRRSRSRDVKLDVTCEVTRDGTRDGDVSSRVTFNQNQNQNNNPPLTPPIGEGTQTGMLTEDLLFEEAWEAYPRHTGSKRRTRSLFVTMDELPSIVEAAREMRRRVDAGELEARYVPSMSKWLENGAYRDCMPKPSKPEFPEPGWVQSHVFAHLPDGCDTFQAQRRLWALIRDGTPWEAAAKTVIAENKPVGGRTAPDPHKDAHSSRKPDTGTTSQRTEA